VTTAAPPFVLLASVGSTGRQLALAAAVRVLGRRDVELDHEPTGRPRLRVAGSPAGADVSISHCGGLAVAAAVRGRRIGVDVEPLAGIPARSWRYFLTDAEAADCCADTLRAVWAWTMKEAAYKAAASPAALHFRQIAVHGWDSGAPQVRWPAELTLLPEVFIRRHAGFAISVVLL